MSLVPIFVHSKEDGTIDTPQHIAAGAQIIDVTLAAAGPNAPRTTARAMVVANAAFDLSAPLPVKAGPNFLNATATLELA